MKQIYLDNAAAVPVDIRVWIAMREAPQGNPSSFNAAGREARTAMETARQKVAEFLGARPDEIIFTGSGSEANNLAMHGALENISGTVFTSPIEHPSVIEALLPIKGVKVKQVPVDGTGRIDLKVFESMLARECKLVSVMYANNEIGTIEPIKQIAKIIKRHKKGKYPLFHVDACQAAGFLEMNVQHLGVDLLTFNGSKIGGPRGIGVLYVRRGTPLKPLILGGGQERGRRAGTENIPAIVGLAKAVSLIRSKDATSIAAVRDYGIAALKKALPDIVLNGPEGEQRLANNISVCVPDLASEVILLELDKYGIAAGSGSACTSHAVEPSHVLKAIGVLKRYINGALRFSLGRDTTKKDMDFVAETLKKIVRDLRRRYRFD